MTTEEADALFLSGLPGPAAELGLGTVVAAARLKVLAALPTELRGRATRLLERFHLDAAGWFRAGEDVPHLATIAECVWEGRRLELDYDRGDRPVTRTLDPLGLVLKAGVWYLVAANEDQVRTYRISRARGVRAVDEPARRPPGFDLAAFWSESIAAFERDTPRIEVTIRVRHDTVRWLEDVVDARFLGAAEELPDPEPGEWRRLRLTMEWPREVAGRLLAVGGGLEILEPAHLRAEIATLAVEVAARYAPAARDVVPLTAQSMPPDEALPRDEEMPRPVSARA
jgi:predicted DNA-binding transcriptional regulator YafY